MPSLNEPVEKFLRSGIVNKLKYSHCEECYVCKKRRHLQARFKEHVWGEPVKEQLEKCNVGITQDSVVILGFT